MAYQTTACHQYFSMAAPMAHDHCIVPCKVKIGFYCLVFPLSLPLLYDILLSELTIEKDYTCKIIFQHSELRFLNSHGSVA